MPNESCKAHESSKSANNLDKPSRHLQFFILALVLQLAFAALIFKHVRSGNTKMKTQIYSIGDGKFKGHFHFPITEDLIGWEVIITFSSPVEYLAQLNGEEIKHSEDKTVYILLNKKNCTLRAGQILKIIIQGKASGVIPTATASLFRIFKVNDTVQAIPGNTISLPVQEETRYNYSEVLHKSILFYAAQRSGKLPSNNPIYWRSDSALTDQGDNGEDLTGGWYDAGDGVKFGFPMAASTTLLEWGLLAFKDAYEVSGELKAMYDCIRWPLEWFIKCHTGENELHVQVGNGGIDHGYWGRPEDMTMDRPAYKITESKPGSDVAAEYAAAMAAGSILFKSKDPVFSKLLLKHAQELYKFATTYIGKYSDSVIEARAYYKSLQYEDELCWGGAWLYLATNKTQYLVDAERFYLPGEAWGQSWDNKSPGNMILLYQITKKDIYKDDLLATFENWLPGGTGLHRLPYTPKGLVFRSQWGSLRYACQMALIALLAAEQGIQPTRYRTWAKGQIGYALGDTGRSFVVGFGTNPPVQPHHRASSCPMWPSKCDWNNQQINVPNPHILYGALVGGPDRNDDYMDDRNNYFMNEPQCNHNAGFQSAIAGTCIIIRMTTLFRVIKKQ